MSVESGRLSSKRRTNPTLCNYMKDSDMKE